MNFIQEKRREVEREAPPFTTGAAGAGSSVVVVILEAGFLEEPRDLEGDLATAAEGEEEEVEEDA